MRSTSILGSIVDIPLIEIELSMIPFDIKTLSGLPRKFRVLAKQMISCVSDKQGVGYFTIHGKKLKASQTLRRGGPHTDGNYEPYNMTFGGGGGGWKVGENGPAVNTGLHHRQYVKDTGGIILASNYESCYGWDGVYDGLPSVGGDCSHIDLDEPFMLEANRVYYGNNHFIHESLPVKENVHRVFVRITMPEDHKFN